VTWQHPLRASIVRHPWVWFFLVALVPVVVVSAPGSLSGVFAVDIDGYALLAALLVAWAGDVGPKAPRRRGRRIAVFAVALLACLWITWWTYGGSTLRVASIPSALIISFALAAYFSPTAALRGISSPLLRLRASWSAYAIALLAWPLIGGAGILVSRLGSAGPAMTRGDGSPSVIHILLGALGSSLVTALPTTMGWYGFAAKRLLGSLSPLVTALVVGPLTWLAILIPFSAWSGLFHWFLPLTLLRAFAAAVVALWVYKRSRGSLVPVAVFFVAVGTMPIAELLWAGERFRHGAGFDDLVLAGQCLLALLLAIQGRMWRRPESPRRRSRQVGLADGSPAPAD
jgi:hypothetical protein